MGHIGAWLPHCKLGLSEKGESKVGIRAATMHTALLLQAFNRGAGKTHGSGCRNYPQYSSYILGQQQNHSGHSTERAVPIIE